MAKTKKCEYAKGKCKACSDDQCQKQRMKRIMTGFCMKVPVGENNE